MSKEKIIDRIRKLLALADTARNANEHEAAQAAAKVSALLFEHNLSQAEIEVKEEADTTVDREDIEIRSSATMVKWRQVLLHGIAKTHFCQAIRITRHQPPKTVLYGSPSNIEVVKYLYDYLVGEIERFYESYRRDVGHRRGKANYCLGMVTTVRTRLKEEFDRMTVQTDQTRALVVTSQGLVDQRRKQDYPQIAFTKSRTAKNSAYYDGKHDGSHVSWHRGVTTGSGQPIGIA